MSNLVQSSAIESALIMGDLSKLNTNERLSYYKNVCESLGLNSLTKPFDYILLNGKLTLYAKRDATDQLRKVHKVSIAITDRQKIDDVFIVTAKAKMGDREDESTGAVNIAGLKGEALANAYMKAETKAKRRVTLSVCGLGVLDEMEVETIKDAKPFMESPEIKSVEEIDEEPSLGSYICKAGQKYNGIRLDEIGENALDGYVVWYKAELTKKGRAATSNEAEFFEAADAYLKSKEFERK